MANFSNQPRVIFPGRRPVGPPEEYAKSKMNDARANGRPWQRRAEALRRARLGWPISQSGTLSITDSLRRTTGTVRAFVNPLDPYNISMAKEKCRAMCHILDMIPARPRQIPEEKAEEHTVQRRPEKARGCCGAPPAFRVPPVRGRASPPRQTGERRPGVPDPPVPLSCGSGSAPAPPPPVSFNDIATATFRSGDEGTAHAAASSTYLRQ